MVETAGESLCESTPFRSGTKYTTVTEVFVKEEEKPAESRQQNGQNLCNSQIQNNIEEMAVEESKRFSFWKATREKKIILILCIMANFLAACAYSVLRPFFPIEAERKGMTVTMMGFIVGVYQLVVFLSSPVMGYLIPRIGVKFLYISGMFVGGCCNILFGLLGQSPGGNIFLTMCILVRCVEAFGFSAFMTASMTIVSCEFEEYVGSVVALLRCANGLGNMMGPLIGGALYDLGGFGLPLFVLAVLILMNMAFIFNVLPTMVSEKAQVNEKKMVLGLFRSPLVVVSLFTMFVGMCGLNVWASTYALYLIPFGVSSSEAGAIYVITPLLYSLLAPLWGYITDVKSKYFVLIVFGHLFQAIAWLVVGGPSIVFPFVDYSIPCILIGSAIEGLSVGCHLIPIMKSLVDGALEVGYKKCPETYAMVSGVYASVYALGGFVGPFGGGALIEFYGFAHVFHGLGFINVFLFLTTLGFFSLRHLSRDQLTRIKQVLFKSNI